MIEIRREAHKYGANYYAEVDGKRVGRMGADDMLDGAVLINGLHVEAEHRGQGIARALLAALHQDHAGVIHPGPMSKDGHGLYQHLLANEPAAAEIAGQGWLAAA